MEVVSYNLGMLLVCILLFRNAASVPPCDSQVYCDDPLLEKIQMAELFNDSKTFVDMHMKDDPDKVLAAFRSVTENVSYTQEDLRTFVNTYFDGPGTEFETWTPEDIVENPKFLQSIKDSKLKTFGRDLCKIWTHLGRKIKKDVDTHPQRYSLIYLPNPFIVPGGRFREIYYWDSYWVIKGLLTCEMYTTVKGMLENLLTFVDKYGKIPNGGRIYYTERSQPPFLIPMVHLYVQATNDTDFITKHIDTLEIEYNFWATERNISVSRNSGKMHSLTRYAAPITKPRPESYKEDVRVAANMSEEDATNMYSNLASAAESGWDFSSRWFAHEDTSSTLEDTIIKNIIPVDLNSILCWNENLLANFFDLLGNAEQAAQFQLLAQNRMEAIHDILWNSGDGAWFDFDFTTDLKRAHFYPSNVFPLYVGCQSINTSTNFETSVREYLKNQGILNYKSGIPTSLKDTGQQWDLPNGWPPLQEIVVTALDNGETETGHQMALELVKKWVYSNWKGWEKTKHMFEKYSVNVYGSRGGGGEYDVQEGFGWTNGVVLDFLARYGSEFTIDEFEEHIGVCDSSTCGAQNLRLSSVTSLFLFVLYLCVQRCI